MYPMEKYIDLHTHTVCSDGSMTPAALVQHAKEAGLTAVAVSDHDTIDGVKEALRVGQEVDVEVIPAIELSAISATETHVLGYFIDTDSPALLHAVDRIRIVRTQRIAETCDMLKKYNIHVTLDEVKEKAGSGILCRAHIAKLMTEKGYSQSPKAAFAQWLNVGCPCYSESQALTDTEAVELIRSAGGDAYLAHLHLTRLEGDDLEAFVKRLADAGLTGIEGYYTDYTPSHETTYRSLAKKLGLKISGGTDFHGTFKPHISIGRGLGEMRIPYSVLENMKNR